MTELTQREKLRRAVACHPDDDLPRRMYADWLIEHPEPGVCESCRGEKHMLGAGPDRGNPVCTRCEGSGVSDPNTELAQSIIAQLAYNDQMVQGGTLGDDVSRFGMWHAASRSICRLSHPPIPPHTYVALAPPHTYVATASEDSTYSDRDGPMLLYRRGFADELSVPHDWLFGHMCQACVNHPGSNPCPSCGGRGMEFGYGGREESCPDCGEQEHAPSICSACHGHRRSGDRSRELFEACPTIRHVRLYDRKPVVRSFPLLTVHTVWPSGRVVGSAWLDESKLWNRVDWNWNHRAFISHALFLEVRRNPGACCDIDNYVIFEDEQQAVAALSAAALKVARRSVLWLWSHQQELERKAKLL